MLESETSELKVLPLFSASIYTVAINSSPVLFPQCHGEIIGRDVCEAVKFGKY